MLARALLDLFGADNPIKSIGMRHGEKIYETLVSAEELRRAQDMGDYFRVQLDGRDLNYDRYFSQGDEVDAAAEGYHSHNTEQLGFDELKALLMTLPSVRDVVQKGSL